MSATDCLEPLTLWEHTQVTVVGIAIIAIWAAGCFASIIATLTFGEAVFSPKATTTRRQRIVDGCLAALLAVGAVVWIGGGIALFSYEGDDKPTCTQEQMQ